MAVAFGSVFLTTLLGTLISGRRVSRTAMIGGLAGFLYGLMLWFIYWKDAIGIYGPAPFLCSIVIGAIIGAFIAFLSEDENGKATAPGS